MFRSVWLFFFFYDYLKNEMHALAKSRLQRFSKYVLLFMEISFFGKILSRTNENHRFTNINRK